MDALLVPLSVAVMVGFLAFAVWALVSLGKKDLPAAFFLGLNALHALYLVTVAVGLISGGGALGLRRVVEYLIVFVGGGVLYTRGLMPGGFMHRILTDPPKVPWGMLLGNGWNFAAVLGFVFFALGGA